MISETAWLALADRFVSALERIAERMDTTSRRCDAVTTYGSPCSRPFAHAGAHCDKNGNKW